MNYNRMEFVRILYLYEQWLDTWQVSEFLETSLAKGPQIVTKRGVEAAVLVPIEQ